MANMRACREYEAGEILEVINKAAVAYRGVIPADRWHEPYMSAKELADEIRAGISFDGSYQDGQLVGVMGVQRVRDVHLIRHAYTLPEFQGRGIGGALLERLRRRIPGQILIGTWAAAGWAIGFYERHGFRLVPAETAAELLRSYWNIPNRQIETSVVLADPPLDGR